MRDISEDYFTGLNLLQLNFLSLYYSPGYEREAVVLGKVADEAYDYLRGFFRYGPEIILLVLDETDWERRATNQPYGNPFVPDNRVHYGVKPPESWKEPLASLASKAPTDLKKRLVSIAGSESDEVREAVDRIFTLNFFAATVTHEIAHPFLGLNLVLPQPIEYEYALKLDAFWLGEFLPQYAMCSFLLARDRLLFERWHELMKSVFEGGKGVVRYENLSEMGPKYSEMIESCVENIYWYQAKLFVMSVDLHRQHGEVFLRKIQEDLRLSERLLIDRIENSYGNIRKWLQKWG